MKEWWESNFIYEETLYDWGFPPWPFCNTDHGALVLGRAELNNAPEYKKLVVL